MKKAILEQANFNPNFIGSWVLEDTSICDDLIGYFEGNKEKQRLGQTLGGKNTDIKNSTDISLLPQEISKPGNEVFIRYFDDLFECYKDYCEQWPFLMTFAGEVNIGEFNVQRYESGQHFQVVHTERSSISSLHRIFAWMTYLNDVDETQGGSTIFSHYDLKIQPNKGLTLIWPAEWTHAHKGSVLLGGSKYIITGWMHFPHGPT